MARTFCVARRSIPSPVRRRILVASLPIQNPTTSQQWEAVVADSFAVEHQATAGLRRSRRTRSRRVAAAAALNLSEDILVWEIFVRLPARDVLRCRAVCRYWHGLTSAHDFLRAHHQRQPSFPLVTLYGATSNNKAGGLPFLEHGRPVLGFDDYEGFELLCSCDGLLLLSHPDGRYSICNPATRQCAPIPCLTAAGRIDVVALYLHGLSGEYRVLYRKERDYYILMVRRGRSPRCIGVPSDYPDYPYNIEKLMLGSEGMTPASYAPPVLFQNCLHWFPRFPTIFPDHARIVVFDTAVESFRLIRRPSGSTRSYALLCDMEDSIGFSCFVNGSTVRVWLLDDYEREVWSLKYHLKCPVESLHKIEDTRYLVLSRKGDVLFYSRIQGYMFHCDVTGKLVEEFRCDPQSLRIIGHWFKENLVKQDISLRRGCGCVSQLRLFQRI